MPLEASSSPESSRSTLDIPQWGIRQDNKVAVRISGFRSRTELRFSSHLAGINLGDGLRLMLAMFGVLNERDRHQFDRDIHTVARIFGGRA